MLHMLGQRAARALAVPRRGHAEGARRGRMRERFGLPVAAKPDSQELCFAPERRRRRVRASAGARARARAGARSSTPTAGSSASTTARSGSRSGSAAASASRRGSPRYVVDVDAAREPRRGRAPGAAGAPGAGRRPGVVGRRRPARRRVRSRPRCGSATAARTSRRWSTPTATGFRVEFRRRSGRSRPGRASVVYRGDELLGGGRIVESLR